MIRKFLKNILGENFTENNAKLATVNFAIILLMFFCPALCCSSCRSRFLFCIQVIPTIRYPAF